MSRGNAITMRNRLVLLIALIMIFNIEHTVAAEIVTIFDKEKSGVLSTKAEEISLTKEGLKEAKHIADELVATLTSKMPAAGLAGPQIGVAKQVFIFSWDRSLVNLTVAINPKIIEASNKINTSWEACFSTMQENGISKAALVSRAESIIVEYNDLNGLLITQRLEGFAAKVFQHEYDHLQGIENISKPEASVKKFRNKEALAKFMKKVKKADSVNYTKPKEL
jgi:peptide deformylase